MTSPLMTSPMAPTPDLTSSPNVSKPSDSSAMQDAARDFEAAFIAQMLTHSGLAESMTSGEGKMASAFGTFFIEQLAEEMAESGGIGLAESIYKQLERYEQQESVNVR